MRRRLEKVLDAFDSPTLPRDMASLLSAWRVGGWFLVLNAFLGFVLGGAVFAAAIEGDREFSAVAEHLGAGQSLACLLLLAMTCVCTLLIPLRASGIFEGPRWGKYFDQIVLSGIAPSRYFAGKILAQNLFFLLILLAALPYAIFGLGLGGAQFTFIGTGLLLLWVYVNMLTLSTLAAATLCHEVAAVAMSIGCFGFLSFVAFFPGPPVVGMFSPSHYFATPIWEAMFATRIGGPPWSITEVTLPLWGMELTLGTVGFFLLGAVPVLAGSMLCMLLGPVRCLVKANATFGEVVMPGDAKKKSVFRYRFNLRRRSEMAFFYENRVAWLTRWEAPIRYGASLLALSGLAAIAVTILHYVADGCNPEEVYVANLVIFTSGILVACGVFSCDKSTELTELRSGEARYTAGGLDTVGFLFSIALLLALAGLIPVIRDILSDGQWYRRRYSQDVILTARSLQRLLPVFALLGLELYALLRWLAMKVWTRAQAVGAACFLLVSLWVLPFGLAMMARDMDEEWVRARTAIQHLSVLSPIPTMAWLVDDHPTKDIRVLLDLQVHWVAIPLHLVLGVVFTLLAIRARCSLVKDRIGEASE